MRILAIRGKNLASLAGEFEVDFRTEPLRSAGLFAISGATGAGKSTLLDALCLALYHDTPRLKGAGENSVLVPDVGEHTTSPQDPRTLLRRGCSEGYAEVDFEGIDGVAWRARWEVRRAHGRADGKLQAVVARLSRCDDDSAVGHRTKEILSAIGERIGLSFDQFRRAVLLAQNDFAALLKAKQDERADLLEALTGTELFSAISKLSHQRHASEQKSLQELQQRLDLQAPLDTEARETLQGEITTAATHCTDLSSGVQALEIEQRWHQQGAQLLQEQLAAAANRQQVQDALSADQALALQLQRWSSIEPLRPLRAAQQRSESAINLLQKATPALDTAIAEATTAHERCQRQHHEAQHAQYTLDAHIEQMRPVIAATRKLDEEIRVRSNQYDGLALRDAQLRDEAEALARDLDGKQQQRRQHESVLQTWTTWQRQQPTLSVSAEEWPELGRSLRDVVQAMQRRSDAEEKRSVAQSATEQAERDLVKLTTQHAEQLADSQRSNDAVTQAEALLEQLDPDHIETQADLVRNRASVLEQLDNAIGGWREAEARQTLLLSQMDSVRADLLREQGEVTSAEAALEVATKNDQEARNAFQRASLVANQHTAQLRELLIAGEPCAVCGATEHPHADQRNPEVSALLAQLGADADHAHGARSDAITALEQARGHVKASERELAKLHAEIPTATEAAAAAERRVASIAPQLPGAIATASALQEQVPELRAVLAAEQEAIAIAANALSEARNRCHHTRIEARSQQDILAKTQAALDAARLQSQPLQEAFSQLNGECIALQRTLDEATRQLRRWTSLANFEHAEATALVALWQTGDALQQHADQAVHAIATLDGAALQLQQAQAKLREACDVLTTQRSDVEASLARLRTQRSELLADDDVDRYVADLEARQQASRDHVTKQHTSLLDAEKSVLNAQQLRARNAEQLLDTQQQLALQSTDLHDALAARSDMTGIAATDLQQLDALIASLPNDLGEQQKAWQQREQALRDAQNTLRELDSKLATWRAQALSQQPPANVSAELDKFRGERDEALQALGALQGRLLQDDQRRAAATDQLAELAARMQEASRWAELSALIGSADGAKFKRYAQQFTLEVLIEYANAHLQRLAPRYRLRRGNEALSLLMIDTDLGDEVRSVHSLSGGETFLVSLALALGLASLSSQRVRVESLFIDEGFGSLDGDTLNMAMQALDRLQADGRRVGVISHVHDMAERIGVEIRVEAVAPGRSRVRVLS